MGSKRFTPAKLDRFDREGRGTGAYEGYVPYHQVRRGDPSSLGRSHLLVLDDRIRELLSDGELGTQYFVLMLLGLDDSLEQYRLDLVSHPHALAAYYERDTAVLYPGTLQLAEELGMKHPMVHGGGDSAPWRATTDFVVILRLPRQPRKLIAVAFKPSGCLERRRTRELLCLEREFWLRQGEEWLLITPDQFDKRVRLTLCRTAAWALDDQVSAEERQLAKAIVNRRQGDSLTELLDVIAGELHSLRRAQAALWQAVWKGELPVDLRRGWRPYAALDHISEEDFWSLNPIASRRSAWTST